MFSVVVMPPARAQIARAAAWWALHRPEAPTRLSDEIADLIESLASFPLRGLEISGGRRRLTTPTTRKLLIYRVRSRAWRVEILALRQP